MVSRMVRQLRTPRVPGVGTKVNLLWQELTWLGTLPAKARGSPDDVTLFIEANSLARVTKLSRVCVSVPMTNCRNFLATFE